MKIIKITKFEEKKYKTMKSYIVERDCTCTAILALPD